MAGDDYTATGRTRLIEPRFQIVFVCTGNRFRSPIAAAFVQKHGAGLPLDLRSLGTLDTGPAPPLAEAVLRVLSDDVLRRSLTSAGVGSAATYSEDTMVTRFLQLYETLLPEPGPANSS